MRKRLASRMSEAFSFMVATAWTSLFDDLFSQIVGDREGIFWRLVYALVFTILAVLFTMLMDSIEKED